MTSMQRRNLLLTAAAWPIAANTFAAELRHTDAPARVVMAGAADLLVIDSHSAAAAKLVDMSRHIGTPLRTIDGDVTSLWFNTLALSWPRGELRTLEGLTSPRALFCLELLAGDHRLRVVRRETVAPGLVHWRIEPRAPT